MMGDVTTAEAADSMTVPQTRVLAIASHVTYGYVGNTMATFVMQCLGCEVAAMNTVHFSNHTGYGRFTGTRTSADELTQLYSGLKASYLTNFDVLLSGYIPSASVAEAVGLIARDLRLRASTKPGSFFWVLDPVMGDNGRLYVEAALVDKYKELAREADLLLPNQFEAELLADMPEGSIGERGMEGVVDAIGRLNERGVGHVVVTSLRLMGMEGRLVVVGSSKMADGRRRVWKVEVKEIKGFFSGTGDMFAALMVGRLREECEKMGILGVKGWMPGDEVRAEETPLAKAAVRVLSSMQMVLEKTAEARDREMEGWGGSKDGIVGGVDGDQSGDEETRRHLAHTKASEVRVVRCWRDLVSPNDRYKAEAVTS